MTRTRYKIIKTSFTSYNYLNLSGAKFGQIVCIVFTLSLWWFISRLEFSMA